MFVASMAPPTMPAPAEASESTVPRPSSTAILNSARGRDYTQYGYHNTFATRSNPSSDPPTYQFASSPLETARSQSNRSIQTVESQPEILPEYNCTVQFEGLLAIKYELTTPFRLSKDKLWHSVYAVLAGTQLHIHALKSWNPYSKKEPKAGRLLWTYTLQHAEIGLAADWKWTVADLEARPSIVRWVRRSHWPKLFEKKPELFELPREHVLRLRMEDKQFLLSAPSQETMLDWIEKLCASLDISHPLEDRSEPKYRSLPRRSRRQRQIEMFAQETWEDVSAAEQHARLVAQQERLIRQLYPNLGAPTSSEQVGQVDSNGEERREGERDADGGQDPEADDLDASDAREDASDPYVLSRQVTTISRPASRTFMSNGSTYDPKFTPPRPEMTASALIRFRRRCTPILLASSPRSSNILMHQGARYQIDNRRRILIPFSQQPPKYTAAVPESASSAGALPAALTTEASERPDFSRAVTSASASTSWTPASEREQYLDADMSSLRSTRTGGSRHGTPTGDLSRVSSAMTDASQNAAAKGKGIILAMRKTKGRQIHANEHDESAYSIAALTPFVV